MGTKFILEGRLISSPCFRSITPAMPIMTITVNNYFNLIGEGGWNQVRVNWRKMVVWGILSGENGGSGKTFCHHSHPPNQIKFKSDKKPPWKLCAVRMQNDCPFLAYPLNETRQERVCKHRASWRHTNVWLPKIDTRPSLFPTILDSRWLPQGGWPRWVPLSISSLLSNFLLFFWIYWNSFVFHRSFCDLQTE